MADKLLWQVQTNESIAKTTQRKRPWYIAIAASVVIGLSATLLMLPTTERSVLDAAYAQIMEFEQATVVVWGDVTESVKAVALALHQELSF